MFKFRTRLGEMIFRNKYAQGENDTWEAACKRVVDSVCRGLMFNDECDYLEHEVFVPMKALPAGRYIYYGGRPLLAVNNCYLYRVEDTREDWARLLGDVAAALMMGGGVGVDYSLLRGKGNRLSRTGGEASGPLSLIHAINEIGRNVMQGGSRRSAMYASLSHGHQDIWAFMAAKDWHSMNVNGTGLTVADLRSHDWNYPAPLDMTNISVNYGDSWIGQQNPELDKVFLHNCKQALTTGEPGFSFNFGLKSNETLRNACAEVVSDTDSDCCNLGSINMANVGSLREFNEIVRIMTKFLICGTVRGVMPTERSREVRDKHRRLGLGLMGMHEWLLRRGYRYEMNSELAEWLYGYQRYSTVAGQGFCDRLGINSPVAYRSLAPTGTIALMAGTTQGIEPIYATAYIRRFLTGGYHWNNEYVIDPTAKILLDGGIEEGKIETALDLSHDIERRISFQALLQGFVDNAISSTVNLPNSEDGPSVEQFAKVLVKYAPQLRGLTVYPEGARGGQPITPVSIAEARKHMHTASKGSPGVCAGGVCGE